MKQFSIFWKANALLPFFYGEVESETPASFIVELEDSRLLVRCPRFEATKMLRKGLRALFFVQSCHRGEIIVSARIGREFTRMMQIMLAGESIPLISQGLEQESSYGWVQVISSEFEFVGFVPPSRIDMKKSVAAELHLVPKAIVSTPMGLSVIFVPKAHDTVLEKQESGDHTNRQANLDRQSFSKMLSLGVVVIAGVVDRNQDGFVLDYDLGTGTLPFNQVQKQANGKREKLEIGEMVAVVVLRNVNGVITFTRRPFERLKREGVQKKETRLSRVLQFFYWKFVIG
jgi:hypothetical protein